MVEGFLLQNRLQAIAGNDSRFLAGGIDHDQQRPIVLAALELAREGSRIEQPKSMHGKRMLYRETVHDHLHDHLGKTPLNRLNAAVEFG